VLVFAALGALPDLWRGAVAFNLFELERGEGAGFSFLRIVGQIGTGYPGAWVPFLAGLFVLPFAGLERDGEDGRSGGLARPLGVVLLAAALQVAFTLVDFQAYPDLFPLLPAAALGFGWLLARAVRHEPRGGRAATALTLAVAAALLAAGWAQTRFLRRDGLDEQQRVAGLVRDLRGADGTVLCLGAPELMVLLKEVNRTPYLVVINGIDNRIESSWPGGVRGWVRDMEARAPRVVLKGPTRGRHVAAIEDWLKSRYDEAWSQGAVAILVRRQQP
jgi:hypothetical protein